MQFQVKQFQQLYFITGEVIFPLEMCFLTDSLYNVSKYMLIAEHSVKSPLAYHFKEIYGENQQEYLALTHYAVTKANQKTYNN